MDPAGSETAVPPGSPEKSLTSVGCKRPAENENDVDSGRRLHKKARGDLNKDMKKVAEIVLVLSEMGKMRGGRNPTDVEKRLMAEARQTLAEMCEPLAPKDIVPGDAVKGVIEDLGLIHKSKDQRLGFRPPRMSIKERLLLTKRKMEESNRFTGRSGTYSSPLSQVGFNSTVESRGILSQGGHAFPPEKPCPTPVSVGVFQSSPATVHVSPLSSTSSTHQLPVNEVQPSVVSRGLSSSTLQKDSSSTLPRTEAAHFRLDGRFNGSAFASQVQANTSSAHQSESASTFSLQPQPSSMVGFGQTNEGSGHTPIKTEGSSTNTTSSQVSLQAVKDQSPKSTVIQTATGSLPSVQQPSQDFSQSNNYNDIARNVQKFLQPRLPEYPNWTPPSVEYMNKALTCQICKATITDVESLLVCDACDKGVHLKCLQSYNQKGIPKGEWHCPKCIISSNGKPLPPKYGRVTRNVTAAKLSLNTNGTLISAEKKVGISDQKINNQKAAANGNLGVVNSAGVGSTGIKHVQPFQELKTSSIRELQGPDITIGKIDPEKLRETALVVSETLSGAVNNSSNPSIQSSGSSSWETEGSNPKSQPRFDQGQDCPKKISDTDIDSGCQSQASFNSLDFDSKGLLNREASGNQECVHILNTKELEKPDLKQTSEYKSGCEIRPENQDFSQADSIKVSDVENGARDCNISPFDDLHGVDWVGDIFRVEDEKSFYQACCVNGVGYKLQDYVLFSSSNGSLMRPSKLQALWEDNKTRKRWAIVNCCYLPCDLPEAVGRPCTPENNEVYESNHDSTIMAGLIQGPCQVLPPNKFKEESERRSHLLDGANDGLQPIFLCKWFYDEPKGLFRAVTD